MTNAKTPANDSPADATAVPDAPVVDMFADFATDDDAVENGKWIPYRGGVEFLIARDGNRKHHRELIKYWKENPTDGLEEADTPEAEEKRSKLIKAATIYGTARGVLLSWKGPLVIKGKPLPYSIENAETLLKMPDFLEWVSRQSNARANYAAKLEEVDAKN